MGGGAWPFLVGGMICLVYSDNERDRDDIVENYCPDRTIEYLLCGLFVINRWKSGNNRSVMPLDVLGRTRATLI